VKEIGLSGAQAAAYKKLINSFILHFKAGISFIPAEIGKVPLKISGRGVLLLRRDSEGKRKGASVSTSQCSVMGEGIVKLNSPLFP